MALSSRQMKERRRRRARDEAARLDRWIAKHERAATAADAAGLLNEAIHHSNKATYWRDRKARAARN